MDVLDQQSQILQNQDISTTWNWNDDFKNYFYNDNIRSLINLHHIKSFNDFINNKIKKILDTPIKSENEEKGIYFHRSTGDNKVKINIEFLTLDENFKIVPINENTTEYTPNTCINMNKDYAFQLLIDINFSYTIGESLKKQFQLKKVKLCELPIMVFSDFCNLYNEINTFKFHNLVNDEKTIVSMENELIELNKKLESLQSELVNLNQQPLNNVIQVEINKKNDDIEEFLKNIEIKKKNIEEKKEFNIKYKKIIKKTKIDQINFEKSIHENIENMNEKDQYEIIDRIKKYLLYLNNENIYEYGGYFIINGKEKVLVSQDRLCNNKLYIKRDKTFYYVCEIKSVEIEKQDFKPAKTTYIKFKKKMFELKKKRWKTSTSEEFFIKYKEKHEKLQNLNIENIDDLDKALLEIEEEKSKQQKIFDENKELYQETPTDDLKKVILETEEKIKKYDETIKLIKLQLETITLETINDMTNNQDEDGNKNKEKIPYELAREMVESEAREIEENLNIPSKNLSSKEYLSIHLTFKDLANDIPIYIIFRALGYESDKEIFDFIMNEIDIENDEDKFISFKEILDNCRYDADIEGIYTTEQALLYIYENLKEDYKKNITNQRKKHIINKKIKHNLLPHCTTYNEEDIRIFKNNKKALFLGYCVQNLLYVFFQYENVTDRDTYKFKRIDSSGKLLSSLFRDFYQALDDNVRTIISRKTTNQQIINWIEQFDVTEINRIEQSKLYNEKIYNFEQNLKHQSKRKNDIILKDIITEGFRKSFKGNWGVKNVVKNVTIDNIHERIDRDQYAFNKEGISQELGRMTHISTLSHLRRVQTPMDRSVPLLGPRKVNATQYGYICPIDTPEGGLSGLIKNLSIQTSISTFNEDNIKNIKKIFEDLCIPQEDYNTPVMIKTDIFLINNYKNYIKIFINNDWLYSYIGIQKDQSNNSIESYPDIMYEYFKLLKRNNIIDYDTSISWNIIKKELHFFCDEGRYIRPVYVISDNNSLKRILKGDVSFQNLSKWNNTSKNTDELYPYIESLRSVLMNKEYTNQTLVDLKNDAGVIEFIDPEETELTLIAMSINELDDKNKKYEYMEIHPSLIFGSLACMMSFINHNPSVRATYSHAQSKQSISIPITNFQNRFDQKMLILSYPQKSIHITKNADLVNYNELPTGNNAIVAMTSYLGYNQEDAIIINKAALNRGMYSTTHYTTYKIDLDENDVLTQPINIKNKKINNNYNKIDEGNCIVKVGQYVTEGDVLVSKINSISNADTSICMETTPFEDLEDNEEFTQHNSGYVVKIIYGENSDYNKIIKIKIGYFSEPENADKFCSRYANKGTIGLIVPTEDMPYTKSGIVPDILINAHSIPSRMTISNLLEIFTGKISAQSGYYINGSPYENNNSSFEQPINSYEEDDSSPEAEEAKEIKKKTMLDLLNYYGFENKGNEIMYNGTTGEAYLTKIFIGPAYYQRLKHIVRDKVNARNDDGPRDDLTKQPKKGRKSKGGIRIGEMEGWSIISHGIMNFMKESYLDRSDIYSCIICKLCGKIAIHNVNPKEKDKEINCCRYCNNKQYFTQINIPYCAKLLINEMEITSTTLRIITNDLIH